MSTRVCVIKIHMCARTVQGQKRDLEFQEVVSGLTGDRNNPEITRVPLGAKPPP